MIVIKSWKRVTEHGFVKSVWTGVFLFGFIPLLLIRNQ